MGEPLHIPVLLDEVVEHLGPKAGQVYVDATAGLGGHAAAIAPLLGAGGTVVLNDTDATNLERAAERVRGVGGPRVVAVHGNFADLPHRMKGMGLKADLVLADLGFASNQIEDAARGFSFMREGPLDMRLDASAGLSAADLVNSMGEAELAKLIREFGEEAGAGRIARKLVQVRSQTPIRTTTELAQAVRAALGFVPRRSDEAGGVAGGGFPGGIDPATKTFQALRIVVNDEMGSLSALLAGIEFGWKDWLADRCRVGIIAFHSLEDRPVKRCFAGLVKDGKAREIAGPVGAGEEELKRNPRARSAKLRVIEGQMANSK